ncbi:UNVERIFIED_CONTAM: hypothetical protein Sindi_2544000 [Sesamum indicum]
MREIHEGSCGNHSGARLLAQKIIRQGFYWPTLAKDSKELGRKITEWCKELKIAQHFTAVANPQANGQTEDHTANATGETPFCLVYGTEAIISAEIGEESQRVAMYDPKTNQQKRSFNLTMIEERRDAAYAKILHHKGLMMRSQDRRIRPRQLQVGDLVLKKVEASKHVGKLEPPWEGPYKVTEIRKKGTYRLEDMQGRDLPRPWNIQNLKKFYA